MIEDKIKMELNMCLELWGKQGFCTFGKETRCKQRGAPYVLYKMLTGNVFHGDMNA
ncbi:MAG: hypothetical protein ABSB79_03705 [Syntrophales bacterium]|jgi:hypothetical protein